MEIKKITVADSVVLQPDTGKWVYVQSNKISDIDREPYETIYTNHVCIEINFVARVKFG